MTATVDLNIMLPRTMGSHINSILLKKMSPIYWPEGE